MGAPRGRRITPHPSLYPVPLVFLAQITFPDGYRGCWVWTGVTKSGYARYLNHMAARFALSGGQDTPLPMQHRCGNRLCVSPLPEHHDWALPTMSTDILTDRERSIGLLLGAGLTNREIGKRLYLSENTIKTHLRQMYVKLGVRNRTEAAMAVAAQAAS